MKLNIFLLTILVLCAIQFKVYASKNKTRRIFKRQTSPSADRMVQDILKWVQNVYIKNSRRIRQGTLNEYLPPSNTEIPRPFQPGYPPAGITPLPPFPFPTSPVTGGIVPPNEHPQPPRNDNDNDVLLPPTRDEKNNNNGYPRPELPSYQPGFTLPVTDLSTESSPLPSVPSSGTPEQITTEGQPPLNNIPISTTNIPSDGQTHTTSQEPLGPFPTHPATSSDERQQTPIAPNPTGYLEASSSTSFGGYTERIPESPYTSPNEHPASTPSSEGVTSSPLFTSPEGAHIPDSTTTTTSASPSSSGNEQPYSIPLETTSSRSPDEIPPSTTPQLAPEVNVLQTSKPEEPIKSVEPSGSPSSDIAPSSTDDAIITTFSPSGFTLSTTNTDAPIRSVEENPQLTTINSEANIGPADANAEDLKHPPHIHAINVECGKEMMTINVEFNRDFNGIIYSKGHYDKPECRYVQENSGQRNYSFTVSLEMCGTEFVNAFDTQNQSYLENVLVFQNESGIQEVWDTVRAVRCLWEGNLKDSLSVAFSIGMLSQEIVTFSGDTAMAKLDVVLGRGPFGEPANGLVKIGEQMTLVVSVGGDPGFDLQVKDCRATDNGNKNYYALTDENGCILKPKLFGAFQKTRETGNTGASIIAYAFFNAFKFPDEMDLIIECNIELCKTNCEMCTETDQIIEPRRRRRRDLSSSVNRNNSISDGMVMAKHMRIILPDDLNEKTALEITIKDHICMSIQSFMFSSATLISISIIGAVISISLWIKRKEKTYSK